MRQILFCFIAVFLLFSLTFSINILNLKYPLFVGGPGEEVINLFFVSPQFDLVLFYLFSSLMLLFPIVARSWAKAWKWAVVCYQPLLLALISFHFRMMAIGQALFWLSSFLCLLWVFFHSSPPASYRFEKKTSLANIFAYICMILIAIELLGLLHWVMLPFASLNEAGTIFKRMAMFETQLFYVPFVLTPIFALFALFAWVLIPIRSWSKHVKMLRIKIGKVEFDLKKSLVVDVNASSFTSLWKRRYVLLLVVVSIFLSFLFVVYAYFPILNGEKRFVGVDIKFYANSLDTIKGRGWTDVVHYAFFNRSDRPLSILIFYAFSIFSGLSSQVVVQFMPLALAPLTVLATYFFMREAGLSEGVCALGGFFVVFSFLMTVGIFSAFLSNWMALIVVLLFSGLFIKALRKHSWLLCFSSALTLASVLFLHVYTWSLMMLVLGCFSLGLFFGWLRRASGLSKLKLVLAVAISNLVVDFVRNLTLGLGSVAVETASVAQSGLSLGSIWHFWSVLGEVLQIRFSAFFTNPVTLFFAFVGMLALVIAYFEDFSLYLASWIAVSSVLLVFGDWVIQSRLLYNMPLHVLATLGVVFFGTWIRRIVNRRAGRILFVLFVFLVVLVNINYGLHSMITISKFDFS
jgi:hypothetical protein